MFSDTAQNVATKLANLIEPQTLKVANKLVANRKSASDALNNIGNSGVTLPEAGASTMELASNILPALGLGPFGVGASSAMFTAAQPLGNKGKVSTSDVPGIVSHVILSLALNKLMSRLSGEKAIAGPEITEATSPTAQRAAIFFRGRPGDLQARAAAALGQPIQTGGYAATNPLNITAPMQGSVEQILESAGGWIPGTRQAFDTALMNGNKQVVQKLLPTVPKEYLARFASEINQVLAH